MKIHMQHKIIYQSHGGQKFYDQTRFSVLTLLDLLLKQGRNDFRIVIFTDRPEQSPQHDLIHSVSVTPEELKRFRGPLEFVHRIKLEVLRRAEAEFGLPFLYVDCDTRWLKVPDEPFELLADGSRRQKGAVPVFYMHKYEGTMAADFYPNYLRLLHAKRTRLAEWKLRADPPWTLWNAGAIGVPSGAAGLFDDVLAVTDDFILDVRQRIFVEQLAFSVVATSRFQVKALEEYVAHYWNYGSEVPILLRRFFGGLPSDLSVGAAAERCAQFPLERSELAKLQNLRSSRFRRWRAKVRNSLYKRKIDIKAFWMRRRRI
jgi:hypothetical protein